MHNELKEELNMDKKTTNAKVDKVTEEIKTPKEAEVLLEAEQNKAEQDKANEEAKEIIYLKDRDGNVRQFLKGVLRLRPCLGDNMKPATRKEWVEFINKDK